MFSTPTVVSKIDNGNCKSYVLDKLINELYSGDTRRAEAILDSFKLKRLEKINTEEPLESDEEQIGDLPPIPPLEGDEEKVK